MNCRLVGEFEEVLIRRAFTTKIMLDLQSDVEQLNIFVKRKVWCFIWCSWSTTKNFKGYVFPTQSHTFQNDTANMTSVYEIW